MIEFLLWYIVGYILSLASIFILNRLKLWPYEHIHLIEALFLSGFSFITFILVMLNITLLITRDIEIKRPEWFDKLDRYFTCE